MTPRWIRVLLLMYPAGLRQAHGPEIAMTLSEDLQRRRGVGGRLRWLLHAVGDAARSWRQPPHTALPPPRRSRGTQDLLGDVRFALRQMRRSPLFAIGAVVTLSLGIGATTAIVSLADATLIHPLAVPDADRVLVGRQTWSYADFRNYATAQSAFTDVAAWGNIRVALDTGTESAGPARAVSATAGSGTYARMLGLVPLVGRVLDESDDRPDAAPVAMISEQLWAQAFDRTPEIVGRAIALNRVPTVIVGVMPGEFRGPSLDQSPDMLVSLVQISRLSNGLFARPETLTRRTVTFLRVAGRLNPSTTPAPAEEEMNRIYRQFDPDHDSQSDNRLTLVPLSIWAVGLDESNDLQTFLLVLGAATLVTLLLACATVANLLLERAERREREFALRAALGAGGRRLTRMLLVEGLVLGSLGAVGAVVVSRVALTLIGAFSLPGGIRINDLSLTTNTRILVVTMALGVVTSLVFSLAPMWRTATLPLSGALRGGQGHSSRQPMRSTLVAIQVGLCVVLLGGGLVFGRAVRHAFALDLGFDTDSTAIVTVNTSLVSYSPAQMLDVESRVLNGVETVTPIRSAGWSMLRPLSGRVSFDFYPPGYLPAEPGDREVEVNIVSPGYLETLSLRLRAGRYFGAADTSDGEKVAIVSEATARRFWPDRDLARVVGTRLASNEEAAPEDVMTVIGVVGDIRRGLEHNIDPIVYMPSSQQSLGFALGDRFLFVSARGVDPLTAARRATEIIHQTDAALPVSSVVTMQDHVGAAAMVHRLGFTLFALFAGLAAVLTATGVYAVVASAVSRRQREIGIRMALGSGRRGVLSLILGQSARPIGLGLAVGTFAFWLTGRLLTAFLLSQPAFDLAVVATMAIGVGLIATLAIIGPSRRALTIDPATTLRGE